jgi:CubicO group peptidase (beta-lactamase class C family)
MARFSDPSSPGASIAVVKDGKIVFSKGYGSAELEYDIPITSSTVFHIASISKQFTAFAILMLENEGRLSINDDIRKYVPEVPDFGKVITLDHLMHHTSGLRDQWELLALAGWRLDDNITTKQILRLVSRQKELNFNPGDEMLYCNTGYTLLAEVVARVSGMSFIDFTRTRIFEPLKMSHTLFYDDCEKLVKNRAYSYYADSTGYKKSNLNYSTVGATSLFTTSEDLCLWALNFEKPLVGKDFIEKMAKKGVLNKGDTIGYAMGQGMYNYKGLKIFEHGGADAGYRSDLMRIPGEHFSVNVLSNMASFNPGDIAAKVRDIYLTGTQVKEPEKPANPEPMADTGNIMPTQDPQLTATQLPDFDPKSVNLAELTGEYYSDELNTSYTFVIESGKLVARHFRTGDINLTPVKENIFGGDQWYFGQIEFIRDESKRVTGCKVGAGRVKNLIFTRMKSF